MKNPSYEKHLPALLVVVFAFILYGNSIKNDYALDDLIVIKENAFTKKGIAGIGEIFAYDSFTGFFGTEKKLVAGGRYRPLSIATFAVEYSLAGGLNPALSHLINILLYAFLGVLILRILSRLTPAPPGHPYYIGIPFIATMLFMAHPVHTEVVANIKGRDELLALLFSLLSLHFFIRGLEGKKPLKVATAGFLLFLGLLSKENAIAFVLIIPLAVHFFTRIPLKQNLTGALALVFAAAVFVFIRFLVLGYLNSGELPKELMNNPFLEATSSQKFGTILYTLGLYVKLLIFPHPLTHDYYPYHIPLVPLSDWRALLPLAMYLGLIAYALIRFKARSVIVFGILFYLLTLFVVSNMVFSVGTFMNERFIFMPSLGFTLVAGSLLADKLPKLIRKPQIFRNVTAGALLVILALFTVKTYSRNKVWKDNFTLFTTDVNVSVNSVKCNVSAGGDYQKMAQAQTDTALQNKYYGLSEHYLEKALSIYPRSSNGLLLYGNVLSLYRKDYKRSISQYMSILDFDPFNKNAVNNALQVLGSLDNRTESDYKISTLRRLLSLVPDNAEVSYLLGKQYGQYRGNPDSACFFLERSLASDPGNISVYKDLGIVYSMQGNYPKALETFTRGCQLDPNDVQLRQNIRITQQLMAPKKP